MGGATLGIKPTLTSPILIFFSNFCPQGKKDGKLLSHRARCRLLDQYSRIKYQQKRSTRAVFRRIRTVGDGKSQEARSCSGSSRTGSLEFIAKDGGKPDLRSCEAFGIAWFRISPSHKPIGFMEHRSGSMRGSEEAFAGGFEVEVGEIVVRNNWPTSPALSTVRWWQSRRCHRSRRDGEENGFHETEGRTFIQTSEPEN